MRPVIRVVTALTACAVAMAIATPLASADAIDGCPSTFGADATTRTGPDPSHTAVTRLGGLLTAGKTPDSSLHDILGDQYTSYWLNPDGTWAVGISPGVLDLAAAHAAIVAKILALAPADISTPAIAALRVYPEPYTPLELDAAQSEVAPSLVAAGLPVPAMYGMGCAATGTWRVEVPVYDPITPEQEAQFRTALAPLGDRVVVVRRNGAEPVLTLPSTGVAYPPSIPPVAMRVDAATVARTVRIRGGKARFRITCPKGAPAACAGTFRATLRGKTVARRSFTALAPGASRTFSVRLTKRQRAIVKRARGNALAASAGAKARSVRAR